MEEVVGEAIAPMGFKYRCKTCGEEHDGIPTYGADQPAQYFDVPSEKRDSDVVLTTDSCVIADRFFFVRGCIEIPVINTSETFVWGVWVSLKEENFFIWQDNYNVAARSHIGPFFGWLCTKLSVYAETTLHLKTMVHLRDNGIRPLIKLEPTDHPLSMEQRNGITLDRVSEIVHQLGT